MTDTGNGTIRKITPNGTVTTLAGTAGRTGGDDGAGAAASFHFPCGIAVDGSGSAYVADTGNNTIRKVTAAGVVTTLAGTSGQKGSVDGTGSAARFTLPYGLAADVSGDLYVADTYNSTIRKVTPGGVVTTLSGTAGQSSSADGVGTAAGFASPHGLTVDGTGNLYVADTNNDLIRKVTPGGRVTTLAGTAGSSGSVDGTGSAARFAWPSSAVVDSSGNLYVADTYNSIIRKVATSGAVTTLAGAVKQSGAADGTGSAARFAKPSGIAVDARGNLYVADTFNHTIRRITPAAAVTTLAGSAGYSGSVDGTGGAARFHTPRGVAVDGSGNVLVADTDNNTIRKVTPEGVVTTLAGSAEQAGSVDGLALSARFNHPYGLAVDGSGNVYIADTYNDTIRQLGPEGWVATLAGTAGQSGGADGTGSTARFYHPHGIALDASGVLFVADNGNSVIRRITPEREVTTLVGVALQAVIIPGPLPARLAWPGGVAVDPAASDLFIVLPDAILKVKL